MKISIKSLGTFRPFPYKLLSYGRKLKSLSYLHKQQKLCYTLFISNYRLQYQTKLDHINFRKQNTQNIFNSPDSSRLPTPLHNILYNFSRINLIRLFNLNVKVNVKRVGTITSSNFPQYKTCMVREVP